MKDLRKRFVKRFLDTKKSLKEIFSQKQHVLYALVFALLIYSFNALIHNYKLLLSKSSHLLLLSLILAFPKTISVGSLGAMIFISLLGGVVISMSIFLVRRQIMTGMYGGSSGIVASLIAPACPSCALGLFSVLGLGGFLGALPFRGLELGVAGIFILVVTLVYLSRKIQTTVCEVKPQKKKRKKV